MDRERPTRYRQAAQATTRAPPRYIRSPDSDSDDDFDFEEEKARRDVILKKMFNVSAVFVILLLIALTGGRYDNYNSRDPYGCAAITNEGRWLESDSSPEDPLRTWQPLGCRLHNYTRKDITTCLPDRRILFVGDQGIQSLYYATIDKLQPGTSWAGEQEEDKVFTSDGAGAITVEFVWDPYLNSSRLAGELVPWKGGQVKAEYRVDESYHAPALFIVGAGIRFAKKGFDENPIRVWREAVDRVALHMRWGDRPTFLGNQDMLMLAPVEHPAWEKLPPGVKKSFTPSVAIDMSRYLNSLATIQGLDIIRAWKVSSDEKVDLVVSNHVYNKYHSKETKADGVELLSEVAARRVDMLMGLRCNILLKDIGEHISSDCCVLPRRVTWLQGFMKGWGLLVALVLRFWRLWYDWDDSQDEYGRKLQNKGKTYLVALIHNYGPGKEVIRQIWRLAFIFVLCLFADRSPFFYRMERFWSTSKFQKGVLFIVISATLTFRKTVGSPNSRERKEEAFSEWTGAALAIHLVSSYLGASTDFSTFALIFLSSVKWATDLLPMRNSRAGALYFVKTLVDINYVAIPMSFMMNSEYVLYQVPALLSLWFVVTYTHAKARMLVYRSPGWRFKKYFIIVATVVVLFGFRSARIQEVIWWLLRVTCGIKWNGTLVKGLIVDHMVTSSLGLAVGWFYVDVISPLSQSQRVRYERYAAYSALSASILYCVLKAGGFNWMDEWGQTVSLVKIGGYAAIRLWFMGGAARESGFLVWLGSMQGAVLVMMNHLWLALDGEAVLDLGLWEFDDAGVNWNLVFWTPTFLYLCWIVEDSRETMVRWVLGCRGESTSTAKEGYIQDRKKSDVLDVEEVMGGEGNGDAESEKWEPKVPFPMSRLEGLASKGVLRVAWVLAVIWILNWMT
ncbi:hypothetical protein TWF481_011958 [Arthrobotrys musiformis]|uniref:Cas1p 10 TM acyl transferase domain-containing protein n=1 Tax=Arthrobotrys musiformis TaxID=47236 RepID=A0AAV9VXM3_9PEZI